jgi:multicomponent Na+:H+ antiporter subunit G
MTLLAVMLLMAGAVLLLIAAVGVLRLPDALSRQHAATKAGTLAVAAVCLGALCVGADGWAWRLLAIVALLLLTLPVASHLLARAAARETLSPDDLQRAPLVQGRGDADPPG